MPTRFELAVVVRLVHALWSRLDVIAVPWHRWVPDDVVSGILAPVAPP